MAAATIVDGSKIHTMIHTRAVEFATIETAANGEDGVTYEARMQKIHQVFITSNEDAKTGPFTASWSGTTVTVKALAGAAGDSATVSLMVVGN
ncbi:MAG: hypothetical protein H8E53_04635 [Planctomycetes bacterium]|nr:hypothetical protein [Planctomycetota bacterium]